MALSLPTRWAALLLIAGMAAACDEFDDLLGLAEETVGVEAGCWSSAYAGVSSGSIGCGILPGLGDAVADQQLTQEVQIQSAFWSGVPTRVFVFDECQGVQNALALPTGEILFGRNMFWQRVAQTGSTLPAAAVMAHEWAHQVQFRHGWMDPQAKTARSQELEADAFSGFYLALAKSWAWSQLGTFYATLYSLGDYHFNDPGHHGTPDERVAAGRLGFNTAIYAARNGISYSYQDLHGIFRGGAEAILAKKPAHAGAPEVSDPGASAPDPASLAAFLVDQRDTVPFHLLAALSDEERRRAYPDLNGARGSRGPGGGLR